MAVHKIDNLAGLFSRIKKKDKTIIREFANALNRAARESVNLTVDEWNQFSTTNTSYIKKHITVVSGASPERLQAKVWARDRATRADNFSYRKVAGGILLNSHKGSAGGILKNAFVVKAKSTGTPIIIQRLAKYEKGEQRNFMGKRFKAVYGVSPNQHFADSRERVAPKALSSAKKQFLKSI